MSRSAPSGRRDPVPGETAAPLTRALVDLGRRSGLSAVGVTRARAFADTRRDLVERKRRGLAAGMQFTYRNPDRSTDPARILPGARALVVGAWDYAGPPEPEAARPERPDSAPPPPPGAPPRGGVARYARRDHYASLRSALSVMAGHLRSLGWRATVLCDDNALVDRATAHRAGLGWYGKNSLFFLDGRGSWFVLGSVVTDAPLRPTATSGPPPHGKGCGSCSRCSTSCPTGALAEPGVVDGRRCLAWLLQAPGSFPEEHRRALGPRLYGCDECQRVCPVNRVVGRRRAAASVEPDAGEEGVDLLELLAASDDALMAAHGRWYIPQRDPRYLRRNALVVLGNVGDGRDAATEAALRRWLGVDDPMLVEHARWAARQLGRDDLLEGTR